MNSDFINAMRASTKELAKASVDKTEIDFMVKYRPMFCEDSAYFWSTLKALDTRTGNSFCEALGLGNVYVEKIAKNDVLNSCYNFVDSRVHRRFKAKLRHTPKCTCVFVVGKSALVVSNLINLTAFNHTYQAIKDEDIQWAPIEVLKNLTLF